VEVAGVAHGVGFAIAVVLVGAWLLFLAVAAWSIVGSVLAVWFPRLRPYVPRFAGSSHAARVVHLEDVSPRRRRKIEKMRAEGKFRYNAAEHARRLSAERSRRHFEQERRRRRGR
jgi:hypothetical protein